MVSSTARSNPGRARVTMLGLGFTLAWVFIGVQLVNVQLVMAEDLGEGSRAQRTETRTVKASRGSIFDRGGSPLAITVESQSVFADPALVEDPIETAQQVSLVLGIATNPVFEKLSKDSRFVWIARQVEPAMAEQIRALELPGIYLESEPRRVYPAGSKTAQVLGIVDIDGNGQEGIEYVYNDALQGIPGTVMYERANKNNVSIPQAGRLIEPAVPGVDLYTTIDLAVQYTAIDVCDRTVAETGAKGCWIVALNAETGEILAMAGTPRFDPVTRRVLNPTTEEDPGFGNFAVRGAYEPGSTMKLISFAAALDSGSVSAETVIYNVADVFESYKGACETAEEGEEQIYGCFHDVNKHAPQDMTVSEIFAQSSNVGTIRVLQNLDFETMIGYFTGFGFDSETGVDFNGEATGAFGIEPGCSSCRHSAAIGYSVAVTPLQMAAAYGVVANDGVWTRPFLVSHTVDVDGKVSVSEPVERRVISEETARTMRRLLAMVVTEGTGSAAQVPGYRVGGKTGTAYKSENGVYTDETMASFVGMAPIDDPKVVVAVVVDSPDKEYHAGGKAAAPAFAEVMEAALNALGVVPDAFIG